MRKGLTAIPVILLTILCPLAALSKDAFQFAPLKRAVIVITKSARTTQVVQVQDDGEAHVVFTSRNAIGKPTTETPTGRFQVEAVIIGARWESPSGKIFSPGQKGYPLGRAIITIRGQDWAIHGTNQPELLGSKVSHACVRQSNEAIDTLSKEVVPGTIVIVQEGPNEAKLLSSYFDWGNWQP